MKAYEFPATLTNGVLDLPTPLLNKLPKNQPIRVILLVNEGEEELEQKDWMRTAAEQFFAGYSDADAIYDQL